MFEFNATLIVAMFSFVVFMFIMNAIFYRPILNIIRKRENYVNDNYETVKTLENKAAEYNTEYQTKLNSAKEQEREALSAKIDNAQKLSFKTTQEANEKAKIEIATNKELIEKNKNELIDNINSNIVNNLASDIVRKIAGLN